MSDNDTQEDAPESKAADWIIQAATALEFFEHEGAEGALSWLERTDGLSEVDGSWLLSGAVCVAASNAAGFMKGTSPESALIIASLSEEDSKTVHALIESLTQTV